MKEKTGTIRNKAWLSIAVLMFVLLLSVQRINASDHLEDHQVPADRPVRQTEETIGTEHGSVEALDAEQGIVNGPNAAKKENNNDRASSEPAKPSSKKVSDPIGNNANIGPEQPEKKNEKNDLDEVTPTQSVKEKNAPLEVSPTQIVEEKGEHGTEDKVGTSPTSQTVVSEKEQGEKHPVPSPKQGAAASNADAADAVTGSNGADTSLPVDGPSQETNNKKTEKKNEPVLSFEILAPGDQLFTLDRICFVADSKSELSPRNYWFTLIDPNGKQHGLGNGETPKACWNFAQPGRYRMNVVMKDLSGKNYMATRSFTVKENPIGISLRSNYENDIKTDTDIRFQINTEPGMKIRLKSYHLYSNTGSLITKGIGDHFRWVFKDPGKYTMIGSVRTLQNELKQVTRKITVDPSVFYIDPISVGTSVLKTGHTVEFRTKAHYAPSKVGYIYYLYAGGKKTYLGVSFNGKKNWTFDAPGRYDLVVVGKSGGKLTGAQKISFNIDDFIPDLVIVQKLRGKTNRYVKPEEKAYAHIKTLLTIRYDLIDRFDAYFVSQDGQIMRSKSGSMWVVRNFDRTDLYRLRVVGFKNNNRIFTYVWNFPVVQGPLSIKGLAIRGDQVIKGIIKTLDRVRFSSLVNTAEEIDQCIMLLKDSDGKTLAQRKTKTGVMTWEFTSPGRYRMFVRAITQYGNQVARDFEFNVLNNPDLLLIKKDPKTSLKNHTNMMFYSIGEVGVDTKRMIMSFYDQKGVLLSRKVGNRAVWSVVDPGQYKVRAHFRYNGKLMTRELDIDVQASPMVYRDIKLSPEPIKPDTIIKLTSIVDFAVGKMNFVIKAFDPDGILVQEFNGGSDVIEWAFFKTGQYRLIASVSDSLNRISKLTKEFFCTPVTADYYRYRPVPPIIEYTPILKREARVTALQDPNRITGGRRYKNPYSDYPVRTWSDPIFDGCAYVGHVGIDFGVDDGTPVYAPYDGWIWTTTNPTGGNRMLLTIANGVSIGFNHLSSFAVTHGDVKAGQLIAYTGNTGSATTGAHLHVDAFIDQECVDAYPYVFGVWDAYGNGPSSGP